MSWKFENAAPLIGTITEGNCWTGHHMLYSNVTLNRIMKYDPTTGLVDILKENTDGINGLNFDIEGNLYGCASEGRKIVRLENNGNMTTIIERLDGRRINSPNDLAITPTGSIYFSDRVGDSSPNVGINHSSIISAEPTGDGQYRCFRRTYDTTMPNGLLFSLDYKNLYVAQSDFRANEKRELRSYPVNKDGSLGSYNVLHDFGPHRGIDGMTLTSEGFIVACTGWEISGPGGMITIFDQKGRIIETHPTPAERPTNCTFAHNDLYVTSIEGHLLVAKNTEFTGHLIYPNSNN